MSFRVLVADKLAKEGLDAFASAAGVEVDDRAGINRDELLKILPNYEALVIRSRTQADAELIDAGTNLKVIGRAGIGVDNVDLSAATRAGVVVMNTPDGNATTTAEHAIALIFSMARMIPQASASMKAGKWEKKKFMGRELRGMTLGVLGLGNIGQIVADRAQGLKMKVVGHDPYFDADTAAELDIELLSLDELIGRADVITVHTPLNDETRGMISDAQIERMKPGVMLINCARGGIYDEEALLRGLEAGKIGAVALDVFPTEPPRAEHPLIGHDRVICTPHLGASTREAQVAVAVAIAEQIGEMAAGEPPRNAVNLPRVAANDLKAVGPYIDLAERMGSFLAQMQDGAVRRVDVEVWGDIAERATGPIVTAVVAGALRHAFDRPVNTVNARVLAEERGIKISESSSFRSGKVYANLVRVTVEGTEKHTVAGTLFGTGEGRFVEVDGLRLEAVPEGCILVIGNRDQPGVIGHVGTVLGAAGVNISRMQLGLDKETGEALSLVNIDREADDELIAKLRDAGVTLVRQVQL